MPRRCALGCSNKNSYHQFPHPERNPDRFKAWVHIAGGTLDSPADYELYRKKVICDIHFTDRDRNRNNRLNFLAVPSLHLPGKSDEVGTSEKVLLAPEAVNKESSLATFKPTLTGKSDEVGTTEKVLLVPEPMNEESSLAKLKPTLTGLLDHETSTQVFMSEPILDPSSTSYEILIGLSDYKTSTDVSPSPSTETILDFPSPISKESFTFSGALDITSAKTSPIVTSQYKSFRNESPASRQTETVMCPDCINNADKLKEHNYCSRHKTDITKAGESKYNQPIPPLIVNQLQTARKKVKQLQAEVIRLRKRNKIVRTRLINAKKNSKHNCLQRITQKMTAAANIFTHMQFTQTQKRTGGRRFTAEGQQLSLSIYKSSPQCYDLLSKLFTLPSTQTLKRLKKQFGIQPGLNNGLDEVPIQPDTF